MAEKALDLLQRITEEPAIAFHAGSMGFAARIAQAVLNQHRQHMHREGMAELVWVDPHGNTGGGG